MGLFRQPWLPRWWQRLTFTVVASSTPIVLPVTAGVLSLQGQDLFFQQSVDAGIGTLTLVPSSSTLIATGGLTVQSANLTLSGQVISQALVMPLASRTLTFTGQNISLIAPAAIIAAVNSIALTLTPQSCGLEWEVPFTPYTLTLTGQTVAFEFIEPEAPQPITLVRFTFTPDQIRFSLNT